MFQPAIAICRDKWRRRESNPRKRPIDSPAAFGGRGWCLDGAALDDNLGESSPVSTAHEQVEFPGTWKMAEGGHSDGSARARAATTDEGCGIRRTTRVRALVQLTGTGPYGLTRDAEAMQAVYGLR